MGLSACMQHTAYVRRTRTQTTIHYRRMMVWNSRVYECCSATSPTEKQERTAVSLCIYTGYISSNCALPPARSYIRLCRFVRIALFGSQSFILYVHIHITIICMYQLHMHNRVCWTTATREGGAGQKSVVSSHSAALGGRTNVGKNIQYTIYNT